MTYRTAIDIAAPPELVWRVLIDVERWPEWCPSMTTVERIEPGMFRTGSSVRIKQPRLPRAMWKVSALTPEEAFTWACRSQGVNTVARHVIKKREDGGTRAESHLQQNGPLAWFAKLRYGRLTRSYLEQESAGLKKRCEEMRNTG